MIAILNDIRSAHNVGSMFRTADAFGIEKMYLVGTTASPVDRFGRADLKIAKVALGAEKSVPWEHYDGLADTIEKLKSDGYYILALEQEASSTGLENVDQKEKTALLVGNEVSGLSQDDLSIVDQIVEIPMQGNKESLNVAVAFGIAAYSLTRSNASASHS